MYIYGVTKFTEFVGVLSSIDLDEIPGMSEDPIEAIETKLKDALDFQTEDECGSSRSLLMEYFESVSEIWREKESAMREREKALKRERERFRDEMEAMANYQIGKHVLLNVGGRRFETSVATLTSTPSFLSVLFSGRFDPNLDVF